MSSVETGELGTLANGNPGVVGTNYATTFVGLYAKVQHAQQSGSLRAYVDSYRWRKCATSSCTDHAQTTITSQETDPMDSATLVSFLRIPTVYVDKPQFWVYFKVTDAQGSPVFTRTGSNTVYLSGDTAALFHQKLESLSCVSGAALGQRVSGTWMYTCNGQGAASGFSSSAPTTGALKIEATGTSPSPPSETTVGGTTGASRNQLTLAQTPHWWHANLRTTGMATLASLSSPYSSPYADGGYAATPSQPVFLTSPTYPIYEEETFDVHVFNAATYTGALPKVGGFTLHVKFDAAQVEYRGTTYGPLFPAGNTLTGSASSGQVTLIASSSAGVSGDADKYVNGFFRYATVQFKLKTGATVAAGDDQYIDTQIRVHVDSVVNDGNTYMVVEGTNPPVVVQPTPAIYATIFDARTDGAEHGQTVTEGLYVRRAVESDRFTLYNYAAGSATKDHGYVFNRRAIDGSDAHDTEFQATVVNDRMTYAERNTAHSGAFYAAPVSHSCATTTGSSSANYAIVGASPSATCSVRANIALGTDSANSQVKGTVSTHTCVAQENDLCVGTADFRIVSPATLTVELSDDELNRIVPTGDASACSQSNIANSAYQTTRVRVYADGLDVTSWATGMLVEDTSKAAFLVQPGSGDDGRDRQALVRGKSPGSTTVKLHDQAGAASAALDVIDTLVLVDTVAAHVITDLAWTSATPGALVYPGTTTATVLAQQIFTAKPAGTSRGHYGYLFVRATYADGKEEEVLVEDTVPVVSTSNVFLTGPNQNDDHAGSSALRMYNANTNRYMVTLAKTAVSECVESSVRVDFVRCGQTLGAGYPKINVVMPGPERIGFNISTNLGSLDLTPTNDGAAYSPFLGSTTVPTSGFKLTVFFDDDSSVDTFADEPDSESATIVYYSDDEACATVDNDDNTLTVVEGTNCAEVRIHVNVTMGNDHFQGSDVARIVRLQTLTTTAAAYPSGSGVAGAADLLPLPCNAGFEKYSLTTVGQLSTGDASDDRAISSSSVVAYASSDTSIAVREGNNIVTAAPTPATNAGPATFGGTAAEFANGWSTGGAPWNDAGVTLHPFTATVSRAYYSTIYDYGASTWNSVPGGAVTSAAVSADLSTLTIGAASTLNLEQQGTRATTFSLRYTRTGPDSAPVTFTFSNVAAHSAWFDHKDIVTFWAGTPSVIDVDSSGTLKLEQNYHNPVKVESFLCPSGTVDGDGRPTSHAGASAAAATTAAYLWANLAPKPEDVDVGTSSTYENVGGQRAPFYVPNGYSDIILHVAARPKAGQYLCSIEAQIVLPSVAGMSSNDFVFTPTDGVHKDMTFSSNANFEDLPSKGEGRLQRVLKVVALHPSTIPASGVVYLGYWTRSAALHPGLATSATPEPEGILTEIVAMESVSAPACSSGASLPLFAPNGKVDAVAGTGSFLVGTPARRRLARGGWDYLGPLVFPTPGARSARRSLQACDPCVDRVFGDTNGDCALTVADAVVVQNMVGTRASYADAANAGGSIPVDPIYTLHPSCAFTRAQFNPLLDNILDHDAAGDYRAAVGAPHVGVTDVTHILRATAGNAVFIEPTVDCVISSDALGHRPDLLVRTRVHGNDGSSKTAIVSANLDLHYDVLVVGQDSASNPTSTPVIFNVTTGAQITSRVVNGVAHTLPLASAYNFAPAAGKSVHSAVFKSTYDTGQQEWVAQLQPFGYVGGTEYYVAIASGVVQSGSIPMPDGYAVWMGSLMAPFGVDRFTPNDGAGFQSSFNPVIGAKNSAVQNASMLCDNAFSPPPSPPPPTPPPPLQTLCWDPSDNGKACTQGTDTDCYNPECSKPPLVICRLEDDHQSQATNEASCLAISGAHWMNRGGAYCYIRHHRCRNAVRRDRRLQEVDNSGYTGRRLADDDAAYSRFPGDARDARLLPNVQQIFVADFDQNGRNDLFLHAPALSPGSCAQRCHSLGRFGARQPHLYTLLGP